MCKIESSILRASALQCLAGVVSAHFSKRCVEHSINSYGEMIVFSITHGALPMAEIDRVIKLVTAFNGSFVLRVDNEELVLNLYV